MTEPARHGALSVWLPLGPGRDDVGAELAARAGDVTAALADVAGLHFARLALVPGGPRHAPGLLFESTFDGEPVAHRAALDRAFAPHAELWASVPGAELGFAELARRHALRAAGFYFAHGGASLAAVREDSALDRRAQAWLDGATLETERTPREIAEALRAALSPAPRASGPGEDRVRLVARLGERWPELFGSLIGAAWFELLDALRAAPELGTGAPLAASPDGQGAFAHVVPLKAGRRRRQIAETFAGVLDAVLASASPLDAAPFGLHGARWLLLPDGRLAFLAWHDGSETAFLDACLELGSRWASLLWAQAEGFPSTRFLAFGGARREAGFRRFARAYRISSQIWYSAYPDLSVADIRRNRRLGELLAGAPDEPRARELCALL